MLRAIGEILSTLILLESAVHELDMGGRDDNIFVLIGLSYISDPIVVDQQSIVDQLSVLLLVEIVAKYGLHGILEIVQMLLG